jgi:hypothetical protein
MKTVANHYVMQVVVYEMKKKMLVVSWSHQP